MNRRFMNLIVCTLLAMLLSIISIDTLQVYASDNDQQDVIVLSDGTEIHQQNPTEITHIENNDIKQSDPSKRLIIKEENIVQSNSRARARSRSVVAGQGQDYLTGTDDIKFFPLQIDSDMYLQVQMIQPNSINIDYNLYVLNSEGIILAYSDNYPSITGPDGALIESCGYYTADNALDVYYLAVMSLNGGSINEPFTIQYTLSKQYDFLEPSENPREALPFTFDINGAALSLCSISSPIDNDWYYIDVPENRAFDKIKLEIQTKSTNDIKLEVYKNDSDIGFSMSKVLSTSAQEYLNVSTGRYYIRICSACAIQNFDDSDIQSYYLAIIPSLKADKIIITSLDGNEGVNRMVSYPGFNRAYFRTSDWIKVSGYVTATDPDTGAVYGIDNCDVTIRYYNPHWEANKTADFATRYMYDKSNMDGYFDIKMTNLPTPMGAITWNAGLSTQYFDICGISAYISDQPDVSSSDQFVHFKFSLYN